MSYTADELMGGMASYLTDRERLDRSYNTTNVNVNISYHENELSEREVLQYLRNHPNTLRKAFEHKWDK